MALSPVMRQASRRSWRMGQTPSLPVKVMYMAYRNTLQPDALKLIAKKLQSSLAVEGELPEDGLASLRRRPDAGSLTIAASGLCPLPLTWTRPLPVPLLCPWLLPFLFTMPVSFCVVCSCSE